MKKLLIIFLLSISVRGIGQTDSNDYHTIFYKSGGVVVDTVGYYRYDTIPVLLLLCDTVDRSTKHDYFIGQQFVMWCKGYEVIKKDKWAGNRNLFTHIKYLDSNKNEFIEGIVIWQSMPIK